MENSLIVEDIQEDLHEEDAVLEDELEQLIKEELDIDLSGDSEVEASICFSSLNNIGLYTKQTGSTLTSDALFGTSQAYSSTNIEPITKAIPIISTASTDSLPHVEDLYSHLDKSQFLSLYNSKCNQVKDMEQKINTFQQQQEKQQGVLRHLNRQLEAEKATLLDELRKQKTECDELVNKAKENESLTITLHSLEKQKQELVIKLQSAEATIQSLTQQLSELNQTDAVQKLRQNYETALAEIKKSYETKLDALNQELAVAQNNIEELLKYKDVTSVKVVQSTASSTDNALSICENGEQNTRELIAQVEDLTTQLSNVQEKLTLAEQTSENYIISLEKMKVEKINEVEDYKKQINDLQTEIENQQIIAESKLKTSLEQCRLACLKLHEDSNKRLRNEFLKENKEKEQYYRLELEKLRNEIGILNSKLVTTQQQLVEVSNEQDKTTSEATLLKIHKKDASCQTSSYSEGMSSNDIDKTNWQRKLDMAVASAHKLWKKDEDMRINESVQNIVKRIQEEHVKALDKLQHEREIEISKLKKEANEQKMKLIEQLNRAKGKLRKAVYKSNNLEKTIEKIVEEIKNTLFSLQAAIIELVSNTLVAKQNT